MKRCFMVLSCLLFAGCAVSSRTGDIWYCTDAKTPWQYLVIEDLPGDSIDVFWGYHQDDMQEFGWIGRSVPDIPLDSMLNLGGPTSSIKRRNDLRSLLDSIRETGARGRR